MASKTIDFLINVKGNATREVGKLSKAMGGVSGAAGLAAAGVAAVGTAAIAAAAAYARLANEITGTVDEMNTLGAATGLSAQTIQGLQQAARASGKQLRDIVPTKLAKNMLAAADSGGAMADAFARAGVSFEDSTGSLRDADVVFRELIDGLAEMENRTEAAGLAALILGKQGRELLTAFEDSSGLDNFVEQTTKFGIRVGPEAVAQTGAWQGATAGLALAMDDLKQSLFDTMGSDFVNARIRGFAEQLVFVSRVIRNTTSEMAADFQALKDVLSGDLSLFDAMQARNQGDTIGRIFKGAFDDAIEFGKVTFGGAGGTGETFGPSLEQAGMGGGGGGGKGGSAKPVTIKHSDDQWNEWIGGMERANDRAQEQIAATAESRKAFEEGYAAMVEGIEALEGGLGRSIVGAIMAGEEGAKATLEGVVSSLPFGDAIVTMGKVVTHLPQFVNGLTNTMVNGPLQVGKAFNRTMQNAIPKLIESIPLIIENLIFKLPAAIARGIVVGIPKIFIAFFKMLGEQLKKLFSFFKGGEDRNIFTGKRGKVLGTSFKKGNISFLGIGNRGSDDLQGSFATGGFVPQTGNYRLHAGERVVPTSGASTGAADRAARGFSGGSALMIGQANITVHTNDARDFIRQLRRELGSRGTGASLTPRGA